MTLHADDVETAVDALCERLGERIVCGVPLGLGKPVQLVNALYARAKKESRLQLDILTALSLAVPHAKSGLERRFLEPFARRAFAGVAQPDYLADLRAGSVPANVRLIEFYFTPGSMLRTPLAQQNYISANYTHVARDLLARGGNAVVAMVAERNGRYSLSCNPDLTLDAARMLRERGAPCMIVAQVNRQLPFMPHDAEVGPEFFDIIVDAPEYETRLFGVPNTPADPADHAVGLYAAALVKDGGTVQLGIGSLGDAVAHWLRARQHEPEQVRQFAAALELDRYREIIEREGGSGNFETGLFAASEMFTWGLMTLYRAGVLKRRVYEQEGLQDALNRGVIAETLPADALERLHAAGVIGDPPTADDMLWLTHYGLLNVPVEPDMRLRDIPAAARGEKLLRGQVLHGAFFLGPEEFYRALHELPDEEKALFNMTAVSKTNDLFGEEALERLQRRHARFINICMKVTLSGAAVSDGLEDGRVVSGVGGQYNFVAMAHELEGARSILCLRATRAGGRESNIVFNYGHVTIPRHLRDIVITEYGIAELRGRTDAEVAAALITVADSRFQEELAAQAKRAGKLPAGWRVPEHARRNTPAELRRRLAPLHARGLLPQFPLGTDFDATEQRLVRALGMLKEAASAGWRGKAGLLVDIVRAGARTDDQAALIRMGLASPKGLRERLLRRMVVHALKLAERE